MGVRSLCETSAVKRRSRVIDITVRGYPQPMKVMEWVWPITGLFDAAQLGASVKVTSVVLPDVVNRYSPTRRAGRQSP